MKFGEKIAGRGSWHGACEGRAGFTHPLNVRREAM